MARRRATLPRMELERLLAYVCDVIDAQGGDWDAVEAELRRDLSGEELAMALDTYAATLLWLVEVKGGSAFIRATRDHFRRLVPVEPVGRRGWRWRATG